MQKKKKDRKSTPHIQVPLALPLHLIPGGWGRPCEVSECGEASAVSVEGDRFAIVVVVQKSFCCGSPLALLTGSGNTSTPSTGLFQDHFPLLPWLHCCNFQVSTVPHVPAEHENSPTIASYIGFRNMQCCVRYIALSLTTLAAGAVWSSAVRLTSLRSSFVNWCFSSFLLTATVTFDFERVFLSSGSRGKEKKKTTRPNI